MLSQQTIQELQNAIEREPQGYCELEIQQSPSGRVFSVAVSEGRAQQLQQRAQQRSQQQQQSSQQGQSSQYQVGQQQFSQQGQSQQGEQTWLIRKNPSQQQNQ
jgi:hypothetical protein